MAHNAGYRSGGGYATGDQMAAFDKLPPSAREALSLADFNWPATTFLARHRRTERGYRTGKECAATVRDWDRNQHQRDVKRGLVASTRD